MVEMDCFFPDDNESSYVMVRDRQKRKIVFVMIWLEWLQSFSVLDHFLMIAI